MKQKLPVLASIFTVLSVIILCLLGNWQIQRLEWKNNILRQLEIEYAKDATQIILNSNALSQEFDFLRGSVTGQYIFDKEIAIIPRVYDDKQGSHIYTPFILTDGSSILVNRGWAPYGWKNQSSAAMPDNLKLETITGLFRKPSATNSFTPENSPEKDQWYHSDPQEIAQAKNISNIRPYILYLEGNGPENAYPLAQATKPNFNNNHLMYAIFWFAMAVALITIYALRFLRSKK